MGIDLIRREDGGRVGLLVSVRNAEEALTALAGGADIIDVKEPARGALGAADAETIDEVARVIAGRAPVTAALGELVDLHIDGPSWSGSSELRDSGVSLLKVGLAGCAKHDNWRSRWQRVIESHAGYARPVAVAYADWQFAAAIDPSAVLQATIEVGCPAILIDTFNKSSGNLFDHWPAGELRRFVREVRERGIIVVLAGGLGLKDLGEAASLEPNYIGVRAAACVGGRGGTVSRECVAAIRESLMGTK
jgi:(5-formylfuran-3-yl)methyl phosphate synthase